MTIEINGKIFQKKEIAYREPNFGSPIKNPLNYQLIISKNKFLSCCSYEIDNYISFLKEDDELYNDPLLPELVSLKYPRSETLFNEFPEIFEIFLNNYKLGALECLLKENDDFLYIINSIEKIKVLNDSVIITGECYKIIDNNYNNKEKKWKCTF